MPVLPVTIARNRKLAGVFAGVMAADTVACAIPIQYIKDDLDRLNVSEKVQKAIPAIKAAGVAGLVGGLWEPRLGLAASGGFVAYFLCALGVHARENDSPEKYVPAAGLGVLAGAVAAKSYWER